jgi:hypothetical protein
MGEENREEGKYWEKELTKGSENRRRGWYDVAGIP